jgi:hypothetical protein
MTICQCPKPPSILFECITLQRFLHGRKKESSITGTVLPVVRTRPRPVER